MARAWVRVKAWVRVRIRAWVRFRVKANVRVREGFDPAYIGYLLVKEHRIQTPMY